MTRLRSTLIAGSLIALAACAQPAAYRAPVETFRDASAVVSLMTTIHAFG
jgi:hypothetical protein